jgi:hypothetical protein
LCNDHHAAATASSVIRNDRHALSGTNITAADRATAQPRGPHITVR